MTLIKIDTDILIFLLYSMSATIITIKKAIYNHRPTFNHISYSISNLSSNTIQVTGGAEKALFHLSES